MAFENEENVTIGDETKGLFRSAAVWMKAFAIIMFVILGLIGIVLIVFATNKDGKLVAEVLSKSDFGPMKEMLGVILGFMFLAVVLFTYACVKLLKASNHFTSIAFTGKPEDYTQAFKSLKNFWMAYGIVIIISIVFVVYMVSKMLAIMQEVAG